MDIEIDPNEDTVTILLANGPLTLGFFQKNSEDRVRITGPSYGKGHVILVDDLESRLKP